eukprot:s4659_g4.t1
MLDEELRKTNAQSSTDQPTEVDLERLFVDAYQATGAELLQQSGMAESTETFDTSDPLTPFLAYVLFVLHYRNNPFPDSWLIFKHSEMREIRDRKRAVLAYCRPWSTISHSEIDDVCLELLTVFEEAPRPESMNSGVFRTFAKALISAKVRVANHFKPGAKSYEVPGCNSKLYFFEAPRGGFARLAAADVAALRQLLGERNVVTPDETEREELLRFNQDWMGKWEGRSAAILKPASTEEVSAVLRYASGKNLAVVPQGGNTGLVGGSVPVHDELVLSLLRMNQVEALDTRSGIVTVQAGCVLEQLDQYLAKHDFMVPLDLGAKGTCTIGGNAATNAGGLRYLRYGSLRGNILGLEAVLADGKVVNSLSALRKDNTGYGLPQLFIGSEGTLGVITKLTILCPPRPKAINIAFFACSDFENVQRTFALARQNLGEVLSAVEFCDRAAIDFVLKREAGTGVRDPLEETHPFYVLIETSGSDGDHDAAKLHRFLEAAMSGDGDPAVRYGVVAADETQEQTLREIFLAPERGLSIFRTAIGEPSDPGPMAYFLVTRSWLLLAMTCSAYGASCSQNGECEESSDAVGWLQRQKRDCKRYRHLPGLPCPALPHLFARDWEGREGLDDDDGRPTSMTLTQLESLCQSDVGQSQSLETYFKREKTSKKSLAQTKSNVKSETSKDCPDADKCTINVQKHLSKNPGAEFAMSAARITAPVIQVRERA